MVALLYLQGSGYAEKGWVPPPLPLRDPPCTRARHPAGPELVPWAAPFLLSGRGRQGSPGNICFPDPNLICPLHGHFGKRIKLIPRHYSSHQSIHPPTGSFNKRSDRYELLCVRTDVKPRYATIRSDGYFLEKHYLSIFGRESASAHPERKRDQPPNETWTLSLHWSKSCKELVILCETNTDFLFFFHLCALPKCFLFNRSNCKNA